MPQHELSATALSDDGSSTESECYDKELLELAASVHDENHDHNLTPDLTTGVKVEPVDACPPVKSENATATDEAKPKAKATYNKCNRCRRKLPIINEKDQTAVQEGKAKTKRCVCCCESFPLSKFSMANRSSTRAIPRCRSCSQAPSNILQKLREIPEYVEAVAAEKQ